MYLAIDTSTDNAGLAVVAEKQVLAELNWRCHRNHSVELMPGINRLLEQAGVKLNSLNGIVVAIGPGSYNGLRVGVSTAKGLAFSLGVPLAGISTMEAAAWQYAESGLPVCPLFNAGMEEIAAAIYRQKEGRWLLLVEQHITSAEKLCRQIKAKTIFCGDAVEAVFNQIKDSLGAKAVIPSPASRLRRVAFLAELGIKRLQAGDCDNPASLQPIYLRRPPITKPKRRISINNSKE
ncbi:tRNA (adenosine(37)-N6)-threonylcarbamoyltransferase complex dimerization subunit type 1 TsaB [Chloroflexota bacterium]